MSAATFNSTELNLLVGSFSGGLGGAPGMIRSTQISKVRAVEFTYTQSGSGTAGDAIVLAELPPTARLLDYMFTTSQNSSSTSVAIGVYDRNKHSGNGMPNGGSLDTTLDAAYSVATAGVFRPSSANVIRTQVGSDPNGDDSSNNVVPGFGSSTVQVVMLTSTAGFVASTKVSGYLLVDIGN